MHMHINDCSILIVYKCNVVYTISIIMLGVQRKMNLIAVVPDLILILCSVFLFVQSAIIMRDDSTENVSKLNWQLYIAIVRNLTLYVRICYTLL